jgi:hypothetical protein
MQVEIGLNWLRRTSQCQSVKSELGIVNQWCVSILSEETFPVSAKIRKRTYGYCRRA